MKAIHVVLLGTLATPAAAGPAPENAADTSNRLFEAAYRAGDAQALANLYAEDAIVVAPSLEIVSDRPAIRDFWAAKMESGTRTLEVRPINVRVEDDRLYQTAAWSAHLEADGNVNVFDGEMTSVLVRQNDGNWKIALQSFY
jgi:uncharacterized protein (TIGR02246 family)